MSRQWKMDKEKVSADKKGIGTKNQNARQRSEAADNRRQELIDAITRPIDNVKSKSIRNNNSSNSFKLQDKMELVKTITDFGNAIDEMSDEDWINLQLYGRICDVSEGNSRKQRVQPSHNQRKVAPGSHLPKKLSLAQPIAAVQSKAIQNSNSSRVSTTHRKNFEKPQLKVRDIRYKMDSGTNRYNDGTVGNGHVKSNHGMGNDKYNITVQITIDNSTGRVCKTVKEEKGPSDRNQAKRGPIGNLQKEYNNIERPIADIQSKAKQNNYSNNNSQIRKTVEKLGTKKVEKNNLFYKKRNAAKNYDSGMTEKNTGTSKSNPNKVIQGISDDWKVKKTGLNNRKGGNTDKKQPCHYNPDKRDGQQKIYADHIFKGKNIGIENTDSTQNPISATPIREISKVNVNVEKNRACDRRNDISDRLYHYNKIRGKKLFSNEHISKEENFECHDNIQDAGLGITEETIGNMNSTWKPIPATLVQDIKKITVKRSRARKQKIDISERLFHYNKIKGQKSFSNEHISEGENIEFNDNSQDKKDVDLGITEETIGNIDSTWKSIPSRLIRGISNEENSKVKKNKARNRINYTSHTKELSRYNTVKRGGEQKIFYNEHIFKEKNIGIENTDSTQNPISATLIREISNVNLNVEKSKPRDRRNDISDRLYHYNKIRGKKLFSKGENIEFHDNIQDVGPGITEETIGNTDSTRKPIPATLYQDKEDLERISKGENIERKNGSNDDVIEMKTTNLDGAIGRNEGSNSNPEKLIQDISDGGAWTVQKVRNKKYANSDVKELYCHFNKTKAENHVNIEDGTGTFKRDRAMLRKLKKIAIQKPKPTYKSIIEEAEEKRKKKEKKQIINKARRMLEAKGMMYTDHEQKMITCLLCQYDLLETDNYKSHVNTKKHSDNLAVYKARAQQNILINSTSCVSFLSTNLHKNKIFMAALNEQAYCLICQEYLTADLEIIGRHISAHIRSLVAVPDECENLSKMVECNLMPLVTESKERRIKLHRYITENLGCCLTDGSYVCLICDVEPMRSTAGARAHFQGEMHAENTTAAYIHNMDSRHQRILLLHCIYTSFEENCVFFKCLLCDAFINNFEVLETHIKEEDHKESWLKWSLSPISSYISSYVCQPHITKKTKTKTSRVEVKDTRQVRHGDHLSLSASTEQQYDDTIDIDSLNDIEFLEYNGTKSNSSRRHHMKLHLNRCTRYCNRKRWENGISYHLFASDDENTDNLNSIYSYY